MSALNWIAVTDKSSRADVGKDRYELVQQANGWWAIFKNAKRINAFPMQYTAQDFAEADAKQEAA